MPAKIVTETERTYAKAISIDYQLLKKADGSGAYLIDVIADDKCHEIIYSLSGKFINITSTDN